MLRIIIGFVLFVAVATGALWSAWPKTASSDTIVTMAIRGSSEKEMLKVAEGSHPYRLNDADVIKLKNAGVPSTVIAEMLHDPEPGRPLR